MFSDVFCSNYAAKLQKISVNAAENDGKCTEWLNIKAFMKSCSALR